MSACSQRQGLWQERSRTQPPQNAQDVGVILDGAQQEQVLNVLEKNPNARVRVLNSRHGLYEIYGVDSDSIKSQVDGTVEQNEFFELKAKRPHSKLFSVPAPGGLQVGDLPPCGASPTGGPTAVLSIEAPANLVNGGTIELGQTVKISATKSQAGATGANVPAGHLKTAIAVAFPDASPQGEQIKMTDSLEFKPDTMGLYTAVVVVQDDKNQCALDGIRFVVTSNRPYAGPNVTEAPIDLSKFKHLAAVNAQQAWNVSQGDGIVIAIVDSGVNYNHPELAPNMLVNDKEIPNNGIDDDKNGFVDDYIGYDFANQDPYPYDDDSHGTHVAGLAAGRQMGLARHAKILAVKAMTPVGGDIGTIAAAIRYAVDRGANIINMSLGAATPQAHPALVSAVEYAKSHGVLLVVAAGNGDEDGHGYDIDTNPVYPASLASDNMIGVAASSAGTDLTSYSNFGAKSVDVVAPGGMMPDDPMYSAAFENVQGAQFIGMTGTSMATPVVSGIAAQVMSLNRHLSIAQVREILINAGTPSPALKTVTVSGRHIDSLSAVDAVIKSNVLF